jgi:hypothetical protein
VLVSVDDWIWRECVESTDAAVALMYCGRESLVVDTDCPLMLMVALEDTVVGVAITEVTVL